MPRQAERLQTGLRRRPLPGAVAPADTVYGGHEKVLRKTVIGMIQGARLGERETLDQATMYVLRPRVRLSADLE